MMKSRSTSTNAVRQFTRDNGSQVCVMAKVQCNGLMVRNTLGHGSVTMRPRMANLSTQMEMFTKVDGHQT